MTIYQCERCHHISKSISDHRKHLNREFPCPSTFSSTDTSILFRKSYIREDKPFGCSFCIKRFSSNKTLKHHLNTIHSNCVQQVQPSENHMHAPVNVTAAHDANVNVNNGQIDNSVNITLNINALGKEDVGYITNHTHFQRFVIKCVKEQADGLCTYLTKRHMHPNHPENHNIRKLHKKEDVMEFFDGTEWKLNRSEKVLETVLTEVEKDFQNCIDCLDEPVDGNIKKALDRFMESIGTALEWDLSSMNYDFKQDDIDEPSPTEKQRCKRRFIKLLCEIIYRFSRQKRKDEVGK
jgi:transcription elongation factor Elf1